MNGVRSISMRKGYLLTALAAAVLLAASSGTALAQVTVTGPAMNTVNEGDTAVYTVEIKGFIQPGSTAGTFTVQLASGSPAIDSDPTDTAGDAGDVSVNLGREYEVTVAAVAADAVAVAFNRSGSIRIQTNHDSDAENEAFTLEFEANASGGVDLDTTAEGGTAVVLPAAGMTGNPNALTIKDDETQTYVLAVSPASQKPTEGTGVTVSLTAMPEHEDGSEMLTVNIDKPAPAYSLTGATDNQVTIGSGNAGSETLTVTQAMPDGNRASDTVTLTAYSGRAGSSKLEDSLSITMADLHALPAVTAMVVDEDGDALDPQPESVTEGESVMIKVMVLDDEGKPGTAVEALKVELSPSGSADTRDYRLSNQTLDIAMGAGESGAVTVMAEVDEDVGMESLVLNATVSGEKANGTETSTSEGVLSLYIMDATEKKIEPKATEADYDAIKAAIAAGAGEDGLNPGETVTLMTSDLFDVMDGYTASYGVSVEGDSVSASASGEMVTIDAMMAGESKVTVTGTASMASSSLMPSQTTSNVASLTFPVMVVDTPLVVVVSADPMEIAEGGTSMITATANRYVTASDGDVEIDLTVVGAGELEADSIMIAMGDMSGYTMLTAMADDDMENSTLTVVATGSGIMGLMQVVITVMDGVAPVPALPLFGQLLLALFMMVGGARLYRRRQG